ncbi:MAG: MaoC family dehydratase [Rhodospirillales bacterium]
MLIVETPAAMKAYVGKSLGTSDWLTVDQDRINKFADATGDHQWIHVDVARAAKEMPGGKTIAHGFLTLSLLVVLMDSVYKIEKTSRGINYGSNKVRFTSMVPSGSRVRLHQTLKALEEVEGGVRMIFDCTVELEGSSRPALVSETIIMAFD